ncbi:MAG TPA: hypothetical protein VJ911_06260 [Cryomorphaceae bacterium]|nr:hypothetical protein [Cryomorphaceae bacterium]
MKTKARYIRLVLTPSAIAVLFLFLSFSPSKPSEETARKYEMVLQESSQMFVRVQTNVNEFCCDFTDQSRFENVAFTGVFKPTGVDFDNAILRLPVSNFDCGKELINKDFRQLLNPDDCSDFIKVEFVRATWQNFGKDSSDHFNPKSGFFEMKFTVAGVETFKKAQINNPKVGTRNFSCKGEVDIDIREFGLEPPTKFMNLIKVSETIQISFDLDMRGKYS